jgi:hypothetical protein
MDNKRILILLLVVAAIAAFFAFDLGRFLNLEFFQQQQEAIAAYRSPVRPS